MPPPEPQHRYYRRGNEEGVAHGTWRVRDEIGKPDLVFAGYKLCEVSSRDSGDRRGRIRAKDMWTEISLYRADDDSYVGSVVGRSTRDGHVDLYQAVVAPTPSELVLWFADEQGRYSDLAKFALAKAAAVDGELDQVVASWWGDRQVGSTGQ